MKRSVVWLTYDQLREILGPHVAWDMTADDVEVGAITVDSATRAVSIHVHGVGQDVIDGMEAPGVPLHPWRYAHRRVTSEAVAS